MSETLIFILLLFAALCHAGWSTIIKYHHSFSIMGITSLVEIIVFFPLVFYVPFPPLEIWYFIFASVLLHFLNRFFVSLCKDGRARTKALFAKRNEPEVKTDHEEDDEGPRQRPSRASESRRTGPKRIHDQVARLLTHSIRRRAGKPYPPLR